MPEDSSLVSGMDEGRRFWAWFLSLGVAFIILGLISFIYALTATFTTMLMFGWLLLISGVLEFVPAFRTWKGSTFYLLDALFRVFIGLCFIAYPTMASTALRGVLATFLLIVGLVRAVGAGRLKYVHYGWAVSSGTLTTLMGLIALGTSNSWFPGFAIGLDLIFDGVAIIAFGMGLHGTPRRTAYRPA